jgi:hypothetical protein
MTGKHLDMARATGIDVPKFTLTSLRLSVCLRKHPSFAPGAGNSLGKHFY